MSKGAQSGALSVLGEVSVLKAVENYNKGLLYVRQGLLEDAVLVLLESIFYAPQNANPIVALAEVYVFLSDLQSAVQQYRRAVWVLSRRSREERRAAAKKAADDARALFFAQQLTLFNGSVNAAGAQSLASFEKPTDAKVSGDGAHTAISIPDTTTQKDQAKDSAFDNDSGVELVAVQVRLAGLLDALGLSLFSMNNFVQALRFTLDALEICNDVVNPVKSASSTKEKGKEASPANTALEERVNGELVPTLELHRCVYLIALRREEEAELKLEAHHKSYPQYSVQSSGLLVNLYVNRQAFRSARVILEEHSSAALRQERVLTAAQHIFNERYRQYRAKALEKRDLGTISQCIEVYPSDIELLYARARIYIDRGQHKRSVKDLFKCIKESNSTHKEAVNTMTDVLIQIGQDSSRNAQRIGISEKDDGEDEDANAGGREFIEEAITYYSESLKWRADNTNVLLARADCYMRIEDYESALLDYRKMLQLNPEDPVGHQRVAFLHDIWGRKLYSQGKVREAEAEFTNAIKTDDKIALFYYHRSLCRFELNEPRYGLRDVLSCQQLNPTDPKLRAFIIRYLGTDEAPATSAKAGSGGASSPHSKVAVVVAAAASTEVVDVSRRRAAALYGQPSARVAKTIRDVHEECQTRANNHGISEEVVRDAMLPRLQKPSGKPAASAMAVAAPTTSTVEGRRVRHTASTGAQNRNGQVGHLTYREFIAGLETADEHPIGTLSGSKSKLQKRSSPVRK